MRHRDATKMGSCEENRTRRKEKGPETFLLQETKCKKKTERKERPAEILENIVGITTRSEDSKEETRKESGEAVDTNPKRQVHIHVYIRR